MGGFSIQSIMWIQSKALRAPGVRSACAVACGVMLAGAVVQPVWADAQLGELQVTATRMPQPVSKALADVTVVTRADIERQGAGGVADVLQKLPGFQVVRNGDATATTSVMIRGSNSRHVLVLVDGVPTGSQATGGATWESLPLAWVERIEVVRGPLSAAYGSDAMGGVVQIITRKGHGAPRMELALGVSDQSMLQGELSTLGSVGEFNYLVGVTAQASRGFNTRSDVVPTSVAADRDGHAKHSSHARFGWQPMAGQQVQASLSSTHINNQYDASKASNVDDRAKKDSTQAALSWTANWMPAWQTVTSLGQTTDAYEARSSYVYHSATRTQNASVVNQVRLDDVVARVLLERREDHLLNGDLLLLGSEGRGDQKNNGLGLGLEWQADPVVLAVNGRVDNNSRFGVHRTGSAAASFKLAAGHAVRASVGTAFRAPTVYQLFSSYGDPALTPETSQTKELGYTYSEGGVQWGASAYRTHYDQLIDFNFNKICWTGSAGCYGNTAKARIDGVSLTMAGLMVGEVRLQGSLDWLNPTDTVRDKWLPRRARQEAKLRAEWTWLDWNLGAQGQFTSRRYDDAGNTKQLGGYAVYSLDASRKVSNELSVLAKVTNASNHVYQTALNYNTEPRTVFVGMRWTPSR